MADLSPRQRQFVDEYLIDLNGTAAAIRAGYSAHTAHVQASRLLRVVKVAVAVKTVLDERARRAGVRTDEIEAELKRIAFSDMRSFVSWGKDGVELKGSDEITADATACVAEVSEAPGKYGSAIRFKLHDKVRALELIGKRHQMFVDRIDVTSGGKELLLTDPE